MGPEDVEVPPKHEFLEEGDVHISESTLKNLGEPQTREKHENVEAIHVPNLNSEIKLLMPDWSLKKKIVSKQQHMRKLE